MFETENDDHNLGQVVARFFKFALISLLIGAVLSILMCLMFSAL